MEFPLDEVPAATTSWVSWMTFTVSMLDVPLNLEDLSYAAMAPESFVSEYTWLRYRNVGSVELAAAGGSESMEVLMGGLEGVSGDYALRMTSDLPTGTKINLNLRDLELHWQVKSGGALVQKSYWEFLALGGVVPTSSGTVEVNRIMMGPRKSIPLSLSVDVPSSTTAGDYRLELSQYTSPRFTPDEKMGGYTFILHVE
jgi:hypothetical protein